MTLSSPGALLRFSLFIDASTSDRSMDGASMLEVVVGSSRESWLAEALRVIQFFIEFNTSLQYSVFIMNVRPIFFYNRNSWPFPKRCFCLACFKLLLFSMASMICFLSCLRMSSFIFRRIALQISEYSMLSVGVCASLSVVWYLLTACWVSHFCICQLLKWQLNESSSQLRHP